MENKKRKIYLLSNIGGDYIDILPHFFSHYKNLGIDDFILSIHWSEKKDNQLLIAELIKEYNISMAHFYCGTWDHDIKGKYLVTNGITELRLNVCSNHCGQMLANKLY